MGLVIACMFTLFFSLLHCAGCLIHFVVVNGGVADLRV